MRRCIIVSNYNKFVCPDCKEKLALQDNIYNCNACGAKWQIKNGVPVFFKKSPPYWCEITEEQADELNRNAEDAGWRSAIEKHFPEHQQKFILDEGRINWKYFISSNTAGKILDAGSGWGTLSFSLARDCKEVVSLESVQQRIEFIKTRRKQDNVENLVPVCGSVLNLPFEDDYFDVVILNGVLEWLGLSDMSLKTDKVQENALREIFRVLKPGGSLYIGIEQRFAFFYFLGTKDPHSGLRFATLMPRFKAEIYSKIVKKKSYRTYIYSMGGYRKLLKKAGFNNISFYLPVPGYLNFRYIIPLDNADILKFWFSNQLYSKLLFSPVLIKMCCSIIKLLFLLPIKRLFKYFVPDYSIIAVKEDLK